MNWFGATGELQLTLHGATTEAGEPVDEEEEEDEEAAETSAEVRFDAARRRAFSISECAMFMTRFTSSEKY
eukprot:CAMPEP_0202095368 /NCGR_PEP_ID=MMETSP0964-20121228/49508_1 /ASSEMBLY_ACC=CAM_ASM_000500 /TAXON_ID=4773 /ORGANISM="Schizochytrium aggregatum, Strain ATCC28209" /LENGTH=70 /DNA_ID=CAMNT_0048663623 /DNA_START=163 /DNA_END=375 /DNA_ORIENTATION=+